MGQDTLSANSTYIEYQNCLTSITRNPLKSETRPEGQNIFGHTDVLINDIFCERQYLYVLRQ